MKTLSESQIKNLGTIPSRPQSPDKKSGNRIRPTDSPKNIKYVLNEMDKQLTPAKMLTKSQQNTTDPKYFIPGRTPQQQQHSLYHSSFDRNLGPSYCCLNCSGHCHCVHGSNNYQVVSELKKMIQLIGDKEVSSFQPDDDNLQKQIQILRREKGMMAKVIEELKQKQKLQPRNTIAQSRQQNEIISLRRQLQYRDKQHQLSTDQLIHTNRSQLLQIKSLEEKNQSSQRQIDQLQNVLKQKQNNDNLREQEQKKKNGQEIQAINMMKEQYNQYMKTLKDNLKFQVNHKMVDFQTEINEYKMRIDMLENRVRNCEKTNELNQRLHAENKNLMKQLSNQKQNSKVAQQLVLIQMENKQKGEIIKSLKRQLADLQKYSQNLQIKLNSKSQETFDKQTEKRLKQLVTNYEQQIKILKDKVKTNVCNHGGIEKQNEKLKQQCKNQWEEIVNLRNQLAQSTADKDKLERKVVMDEDELNKLKDELNNEQEVNNRLENENNQLKKELQQHSHALKIIQELENQNQKLKKIIQELENQNEKLKKDLQDKQKVQKNKNELLLQNENLKDEIEQLKHKNTEMEENNNQTLSVLSELRNEYHTIQEERNMLTKQIEQRKQYHENEIKQLQEKIKFLQNELTELKKEYQNLQQNLRSSHQDESKKKDDKIYDHELTIANLAKIVQQSEMMLVRLRDVIKKLTEDNQNLYNQMLQQRTLNQNNFKKKTEEWEKDNTNMKSFYENQINKMKETLNEKQTTQKQLLIKIATYKSESLRQQLQQLKQLVNDGQLERLEEENLYLSQNYERLLIQLEEKNMKINTLQNELNELKQRITQLQKIRLAHEQQINVLTGNVNLIEKQLKQRKVECLSLLNQKTILEKENLMLKKIRSDKEARYSSKNRGREILMKVDKLIEMENKREQIMDATNNYNENMTQSIIRRI